MTTGSRRSGPRPLVGILVFDDVEVLDFAGPYEVCSGTRDPAGDPYVDVVTVGPVPEVRCRGGLRVRPDHGFDDCPPLDTLVVPGGPGADDRTPLQDALILPFLRQRAESTATVASVCTGPSSWVGRACSTVVTPPPTLPPSMRCAVSSLA